MKHWAVVLALAGGTVLAQPQSPLDAYNSATYGGLLLCSLARQNAVLEAELRAAGGTPPPREPGSANTPYPDCISQGKVNAKKALDRVLPTIRKPAAREALKTVHVAFVSALEGLRPGPEELVIDYRRRQQRLSAALDEAWTRFEVEK